MRSIKATAVVAFFLVHGASADELAKQSQNPLGTIISMPFENNVYTGIGPSDSTAYALNMKPVYPTRMGQWNLVNRFILPVIYSEGQDRPVPPGLEIDTGYSGMIELAQGSAFGLGDLTYQAFFSPADIGDWIWGVGPAFATQSGHSLYRRFFVQQKHHS